jgi:benzoyl-CoA reductase subunit C
MITGTSGKKAIFMKINEPDLKKSVLYTCSYIPQEIITAAGLIAYRIEADKLLKANDSYFPTNFCPYIKNIASYLLEKRDQVRALILATSCDGMRRLYDIASRYVPEIEIFMLDVPRTVTRQSIDFFALNLQRMAGFLEEKVCEEPISLDCLRQALITTERKNALMEKAKKMYCSGKYPVGLKDYFDIFKASLTSEARSFNSELEKYLGDLKNQKSQAHNQKKNVMVMGNYINDEKLWDILSSLDVRLCIDDICFSHRAMTGADDVPVSGDKGQFFRSLASRYLKKPACFRMADLGDKLAKTREEIKTAKIDALIYVSLKFCDTALYFYPFLKEELTSLAVPSLFLEIEHNKTSVGQIRTRIEAFLEMI